MMCAVCHVCVNVVFVNVCCSSMLCAVCQFIVLFANVMLSQYDVPCVNVMFFCCCDVCPCYVLRVNDM